MISIVIPILNEARNISRLILELSRESEPHEIIVVDGGSTDDSIKQVYDLGITVMPASGGRGGQIAAGIASTAGDIVLMLHADSYFPIGGLSEIRKTLEDNPSELGGNFRLVFEGESAFSDWITRF